MPLFFHTDSAAFQLGIWQMDEPLDALEKELQLSVEEQGTFQAFKSEYRKREWLTTRLLDKTLLSSPSVNIAYDSNGKPRLVNSDQFISISHTKNFVAVLLGRQASVGIDLETIQPRIERIAKKFVTAEEEQFIEAEKKIRYHHVIWGAKESLFKIYGKGELNFLEHLHTDKFIYNSKGELSGRIEIGSFRKQYRIFYEELNGLMLVYAMG